MRGRETWCPAARWGGAIVGLLLGCALPAPAVAWLQAAPVEVPDRLTSSLPPEALVPVLPPEPPEQPSPSEAVEPTIRAGPGDLVNPPGPSSGWLEDRRLVLEENLGDLAESFDLFFDRTRRLDLDAPSTRYRVKTFVRTSQVENFSMGLAVGTSITLPRLQHLFGNARLLLFGEKVTSRVPQPSIGARTPTGEPLPVNSAESDAAVAELTRGRGRAELRFDVVRAGVLVFDTGTGFTFAWPPVPFANIRAHLRLQLGGGFLLRATDVLFIELGGQGPGTNVDLEMERYLWPTLRLRWEGHGLYAEHTRGIVWSTLVGAEWRAHARTGFVGGLGCVGFGTPSPSLDVWRAWAGVRQDVWRNWIFVELEPEYTWPREVGMPRVRRWAITARLEVVLEGRERVTKGTP